MPSLRSLHRVDPTSLRSWTCKGQSSRSCLTSAYKPRADVSVVSHHLSGWTNTCPSGTSWSDPHPFAKSARLNPCLTADLPLFPQAYDFAGGWSDVTSHQAQLFGPPSEPSVDAAVSFYRSRGVRPDKLVIGASFHISLSLCDTRLTSLCSRPPSQVCLCTDARSLERTGSAQSSAASERALGRQ